MAALRPPDEIRTARLTLRQPRLADAETLFRTYAQDPEVTRYLVWPPHRELGETRSYLVSALAERDAGRAYTYIIDGDAASCIGAFAFHPGPRQHGFTVGYVLARAWWGKGYMTEALAAAVDWAFAQPQIFRIAALCDIDNKASARVMEKAGLQLEGILRRYEMHPNVDPDRPRDALCYSIVRT